MRRIPGIIGRFLLRLSGLALRLVYVLAITLAAVLVWLLFTTSGAQWLAERAVAEDERLSLSVTGGSLWNGLEVRDLRWRSPGITVDVPAAETRWNPLCLLRLEVCVQQVTADGADVHLDTGELPAGEAAPAEEGGAGDVSLPVAVSLGELRLRDARVQVDDRQVAWRDLRIGARAAGSEVVVRELAWEGIRVDLPAAEAAPAEGPGFLETGWSALELPEVALPVDVVVQDLALRDLRVRQGDAELAALDAFRLAATVRDSDLTLDELAVRHPDGRLDASGHVTMRDDWPLELDLAAEAQGLPQLGEAGAQVELRESFADLAFALETDGVGGLALSGRVAPGSDQLPFDINGDWAELGWPLDSGALVRATEGELAASGSLQDYTLELAATLAGEQIPEGRWTLDASGNLQSASIRTLRGETLDGTLAASGDVAWSPALRWDAEVRLDALGLDQQWPRAPAAVTGDVRTSGSLGADGLGLEAEIPGLEGRLQGETVALSGAVTRPAGGDWQLDGLRVEAADGELTADGRVGTETLDVTGAVDVPDLGTLAPAAGGRLSGDFSASGALTRPDVDVDLEGGDLAWESLGRIGTLDLTARVTELGRGNSRLDLRVTDGEGFGESLDRLTLALTGRRGDHRLELSAAGPRGALSLTAAGGLPDDGIDWDGALEQASVTAFDRELRLDDRAPIRFRSDGPDVRVGSHCWRHDTARLCVPEPLVAGASGEGRVALDGLDLAWLAPLLPVCTALEGQLNATVAARWGDGVPAVDLEAGVTEGVVRLTDPEADDEDADDLVLPIRTLELNGGFDDDGVRGELTLASETLGQADLAITAPSGDGVAGLGPIDGTVSVQSLRLGVFEPFFPALRRLEGTLSASGELAGAMTDPTFDGTIELADGRVEPQAVGVDLRDIALEVAVAGRQADLDGSFRSGDGSAEISGSADWSDPASPAANVGLKGSGLHVVYEPLADLRVNPDLNAELADGVLRLGGSITVPRGAITLASLPPSAVRVSGDVVMVEDRADNPDGRAEPLPDETPPGLTVATDVRLVLGDKVSISGYGIEGQLTGDLRVKQSGSDPPQGNGEIRIRDGEYRAYGQRLQIREGQLLFAGPLQRPQLYVEAVRHIERDDVTAGLRLEGNPEEPRVSLFSEPAMPEEEVLSYIVLGRGPGGGGSQGEDTMMARAAVGLGVAGGGRYATAIAEELGVEDFSIDTAGDGEDTRVEVGGFVSPNLYVGYGVGVFTPETTLRLRYQLAQNLFLEAATGLESAVDLLYRFEFGGEADGDG
ncbi:MAG: translocation/assembly module TamB domain-containing protein [Ectothiorhodospiraceae bacterium]